MGEQRGFAHLLTAFRLQMYENPCCFPLGGFENARLRKYTEKRKNQRPAELSFRPFSPVALFAEHLAVGLYRPSPFAPRGDVVALHLLQRKLLLAERADMVCHK